MNITDWDDLLRTLRNIDDVDGAVEAAEALQARATAEDVPQLMDLLSDPDVFVRGSGMAAVRSWSC
jgi:HEAT repeat protein